MQFVVFTTMEHHQVVHVAPREIKCGSPIYLAYTHTECGHYDAVVQVSYIESTPSHSQWSEDTLYCTCGKNKSATVKESVCIPIVSKYTSTVRCKCLKNGNKCTPICRCTCCGNGKPQYKMKSSQDIPIRLLL